MVALVILILVALAAVAGYFVGLRRRPVRVSLDAIAPAPSPASVPAQLERRESGGAPREAPPARPDNTDRIGEEKARIIRSLDAEAAMLRRKIAECDASRSQLEDFARERKQLFGELAQSRSETARYRQLIVDIENNAPPPILSGAAGPDDLKLIVGVGPVLERMLHTLGVTTFRQIAHWTERDVAEFDARLPEFPGRIVRDQWVIQARALHQSKYGEALDAPRSRG
jgi:predicted flap endonuclease-1-like 5' DNA nuclease